MEVVFELQRWQLHDGVSNSGLLSKSNGVPSSFIIGFTSFLLILTGHLSGMSHVGLKVLLHCHVLWVPLLP